MKRNFFICLVALILYVPMLFAQSKTSQQKRLSLFGVQLGCTKAEFYSQLHTKDEYNNFAEFLGENVVKAYISPNYYAIEKDEDIIYQPTVMVSVKYDFHLDEIYNLFRSLLSAKYGSFESGYMDNRTPCLLWDLSYGQIMMWRHSSTEIAIQYTDYTALKTKNAVLYDLL